MASILKGEVISGNKIGRRIGFPTANLSVGDDFAVADGVYTATVEWQGEKYRALANIGRKPTVSHAGTRVLEVHLFDFDRDLYGQQITVTLERFLRPERRFDSLEALQKQIEQDKNNALK